MLDFIKGSGTSDYKKLLNQKPQYRESLYLDVDENRLWFDGKALDVRVQVSEKLDEHDIRHKVYTFTNPNEEEVVIDDAYIEEIQDYKLNIEPTSSNNSNGLMGVYDKFLLEATAKLLGIVVEQNYSADVNLPKDYDNGDPSTLTPTRVYKNENDEWCYNYASYMVVSVNERTGEFIGYVEKPAGTKVITSPTELASVRASELKLTRKFQDFNYFDGGDRPDDQETLATLGGIQQGTTIEDLEKLTVSEVIARLLFQEAEPAKITDTSAYIKFTDSYIERNGILAEASPDGRQYIEIGAPYPLENDFETVFTPATWGLMFDGKFIGEKQILEEYVHTTYRISDMQHPWNPGHGPGDPSWNDYDVADASYEEHYIEHRVADGDKSIYYGVIQYRALQNAHDQFGNETYIDPDTGEVKYYYKAEDGSFVSENMLDFTGDVSTTNPYYQDANLEFSLWAAWRLYTNAPYTTKDGQYIWDNRNEEPEDTFDPSTLNAVASLAIPGQRVYFKWPSHTVPNASFIIYIPENYNISEIAAAHDGANYEWSARCKATQVLTDEGDPSVRAIRNKYNQTNDYYVYEIQKSAGITNVMIELQQKPIN